MIILDLFIVWTLNFFSSSIFVSGAMGQILNAPNNTIDRKTEQMKIPSFFENILKYKQTIP